MEGEKTFTNTGEGIEYVVQVKGNHYRWLWLLLLLLLPLLLLLRFGKDVCITATDATNSSKVEGANVKFTYVDYALIKTNPFRFFAADTVKLDGTTLPDGKVTFTDVKYTLYSVIFHGGQLAEVFASSGCLASDTLHPLFGSLQDLYPYDAPMSKARVDVVFAVVDKEDNQPLSNADVEVVLEGNVTKLTTDNAGYVTVPGLDKCGNVDINAQMSGYKGDTIRGGMDYVLLSEQNRTLRLQPGLGVVSFTVKDLDNGQPIPNAMASLIVNGDTIVATTNTNGVGKGMFNNISASRMFEVGLSKMAYADTLSQKYKVSEFEKLPESERVFRMRPVKGSLVFRNLDTLSNTPIAGVSNLVLINNNEAGTFVSNSLGCFTVGNIGDNDKVTIKSTHPSYRNKVVNLRGKDVNSNNQNKRDVLLMPQFTIGKPSPERHCGVHFSGTLLSDEAVSGHITKIYSPDKYGEYVGEGQYPSNRAAFPKAVASTFDAIAVDKNTHLTLYSKPNYQGAVLLDVDGPCLINNVKWKNDTRLGDFINKNFSPEFESNYPKSCRKWSSTDMNAWDFGSAIIKCKN